jgi:rhodanese-related sulfurtransferase
MKAKAVDCRQPLILPEYNKFINLLLFLRWIKLSKLCKMRIILKLSLALALIFAEYNLPAQSINSFVPEKFRFALSEDEKPQIIDVRTKAEFDAGHIDGAVNIDINQIDFQKKINKKLKKDRIVYVYCRTGVRSLRAAKILSGLEFSRIYNLEGGLEAWKKLSYPVRKKNSKGNL